MVTMGACLCKGHQESQNGQQYPMGELPSWTEGQPIVQGNHQPYNGSVTDKKNDNGYSIGELATSSLIGLVATIKEHITKPTAMAQGRVAHLIEWKGWGGEGTAGGGWCGWNREGGWGGAGATLQEDEQLYSHLTDEIKEARFAAGVAEQFALAEASLSEWPSQDVNQATTNAATLQAREGLYLSQFLMDGGSLGVPQHLYSLHVEANAEPGSQPNIQAPQPFYCSLVLQPELQQPLQEQRTLPANGPVRHADSSSEDEVFYN
ncbi:protein FAM131C [Trichomycterus rosablanca]|uniref:protein FAM131C n=1 Tax=Trichomycterus rosablanca TaxID=2290929 RepID=UPI002F354692